MNRPSLFARFSPLGPLAFVLGILLATLLLHLISGLALGAEPPEKPAPIPAEKALRIANALRELTSIEAEFYKQSRNLEILRKNFETQTAKVNQIIEQVKKELQVEGWHINERLEWVKAPEPVKPPTEQEPARNNVPSEDAESP